MSKYYISFVALSMFIFAVVVAGVIVVSPSAKRDETLDKTRIEDFNNIHSQIDSYYSNNHKLPISLDELGSSNIKDPQTLKSYTYETTGESSYKLCTEFSTDSLQVNDNSNSYYSSGSIYNQKHKKGYDCLSFKISDYLLNSIRIVVPTIHYYPTPRTVEPTIYNNSAPSVLVVDSSPQGITMTSTAANYAGTTHYIKSNNGVLSVRIDAPLTAVIGGINYEFKSWLGCNNDTFADQYCTVLVNGTTENIIATYTISGQTPPQY